MKLQKENIPFTMVANDILCDKSLSWKAKGLYAYLFSKPDGWDFAGRRIVSDGSDGKHIVFTALKELEDAGYLERIRSATGRIDYMLKHSTQIPKIGIGLFEATDSQKATSQKVHIPKTGIPVFRTVSNKDIYKEGESHSNKDLAPEARDGLVPEVIKLFEGLDMKNKTYYGNTTQRKACEFMIKEYGFDRIKSAIEIVKKKRGTRMFPSITSPHEMMEKWTKVAEAIMREGSELKSKTQVIFS